MELQQLKYVIAICQSGSFTKAAEALYVSQSSLSQQVQKLERELGVQLFQRTTRSLSPTEAGLEFCRYAQETVDAYQRLLNAMENRRRLQNATLTILSTARFQVLELSKAISEFHSRFPEITLEMLLCSEAQLDETLSRREWDVAFLRKFSLPSGTKANTVCFEPFLEDPIDIFVCEEHPLTALDHVSAMDITDYKIVSGNVGSPFYLGMLSLFPENFGAQKKSAVYTNNHATMAELVRSGQAISAGNRSVARYYGLATVPLEPRRTNDAYLVYPVSKERSPALQSFRQYIKEYYRFWLRSPDV